jgi:hypothetical protein
MKRQLPLAACALAVTMMFSACGKDSTIAATIDGMQIPAGIFINFQSMAYTEAMSKVSEAADEAALSAATTTAVDPATGTPILPVSTAAVPLLEDSIDGVPVTAWIHDTAVEDMREYAAVEKHFADLGLTFKDNDDTSVKNYIEQNWEYFGPQLDELGISRSSYEKSMLNSLKRQELQLYYFGKDGEKAVSDDEIKKYLLENYARINYITMDLKDGEGNLLKSDGKSERMAMAEDYVKRAEAGEDFNTLLAEYNDYYAALQEEAAKAAAETATADGTAAADGTATDDTSANTTATDDTDEVDPNAESQAVTNETVVQKEGTLPSADVVTEAYNRQTANPGKTEYFIVEDPGGEIYYVVAVMDLFSDPEYLEANREYVSLTLSEDDFNELVKTWTASQEVILNDKAMARYKAEKIDKIYNAV